jgi:hypothetical protein
MIQQQKFVIPQKSNVSPLKISVIVINALLFGLNAVLFALAIYVNVMFSNFQGLIDRGALISGTLFAVLGMAAAIVGQSGVSKNSVKLLKAAAFLTAVCIAVESGIGGALLAYLGLSATVAANSTSTGLAQADALVACSYRMCCLGGCGISAASESCLNATLSAGYMVCSLEAARAHLPVAACSLVTAYDWPAVCASTDTYTAAVASLVRLNAPRAGYVALAAVVIELLSLMLFIHVMSKPRDVSFLPW